MIWNLKETWMLDPDLTFDEVRELVIRNSGEKSSLDGFLNKSYFALQAKGKEVIMLNRNVQKSIESNEIIIERAKTGQSAIASVTPSRGAYSIFLFALFLGIAPIVREDFTLTFLPLLGLIFSYFMLVISVSSEKGRLNKFINDIKYSSIT